MTATNIVAEAIDRDKWLASRRLGSSDIAAVCGIDPWRTPFHVFLAATRRHQTPESPAMSMGKRLESIVADLWEERTGLRLARVGLAVHKDNPWMTASVDRVTANLPTNPVIVECKTSRTAEGWGEPGTDEVPANYLTQVQWQMACSGPEYQTSHVAVLFGLSDFAIYIVPRSDSLIDKLIGIGRDFWALVERNEAPEPDWSHPDTAKLLEKLYTPDPEKSIVLGDAALAEADNYQSLGSQIDELEGERARVRANLVLAMGDAAYGLLPDGRRIHRQVIDISERTQVVKAHQQNRLSILKSKARK